MAFDYKKEYKALYQPPREPQFVTVPAMTFAAVGGRATPTTLQASTKQPSSCCMACSTPSR